MVQVDDVMEDEVPPSQERLSDAEEIETLVKIALRPTVKMHLEALAKKLRKESEALTRVEASRKNDGDPLEDDEEMAIVEDVENQKPAPKSSALITVAPPPKRVVPPTAVLVASPSVAYVPIDKFLFDAGKYGSEFVTLYIDLLDVGSLVDKNNITCQFTTSSFDLIVKDYKGKSYRLWKDDLANEIDPDRCKKVVKANKIVIKLGKKKTDYGSYEHWTELTAKNKKKKSPVDKENPAAGIMDLMKDMYETGDDNMKKIIGETMMKQRNGELGPGKGGVGDMDMDL